MKYWKVRNHFYLHEAALLMLGCNPDDYNNIDELFNSPPRGFKALYGRVLESACLDAGVEESQEIPGEYYRVFELITNKPANIEVLNFQDGVKLQVGKTHIVDWIERNKNRDNPLPDGFFTVGDSELGKEKSVDTSMIALGRERNSMLKIIRALACNGYKYPNHGAIKEMMYDFDRHGNGVSEKTLTKFLKEADEA